MSNAVFGTDYSLHSLKERRASLRITYIGTTTTGNLMNALRSIGNQLSHQAAPSFSGRHRPDFLYVNADAWCKKTLAAQTPNDVQKLLDVLNTFAADHIARPLELLERRERQSSYPRDRLLIWGTALPHRLSPQVHRNG